MEVLGVPERHIHWMGRATPPFVTPWRGHILFAVRVLCIIEIGAGGRFCAGGEIILGELDFETSTSVGGSLRATDREDDIEL